MSYLPCIKCRKEIRSKAKKCMYCGYKYGEKGSDILWLARALVLAFIIFVIIAIAGGFR